MEPNSRLALPTYAIFDIIISLENIVPPFDFIRLVLEVFKFIHNHLVQI